MNSIELIRIGTKILQKGSKRVPKVEPQRLPNEAKARVQQKTGK